VAKNLRQAIDAVPWWLRATEIAEAELVISACPTPGTVKLTDRAGEPLWELEVDDNCRRAASDLVHIARWRQVKNHSNPVSRLADAVSIEVIRPLAGERVAPRDRVPARPDADGVFRLYYGFEGGQSVVPGLFLRLRNNTEQPLHYALLEMTDHFSISVGPNGAGRLEPGAVAAAAEGKLMRFPLRDDDPEILGKSIGSRRDWFKLIVSTEEITVATFVLPAMQRRKPAPRLKSYRGAEVVAASSDWWSIELAVSTQTIH
jgi:hypothetical protein